MCMKCEATSEFLNENFSSKIEDVAEEFAELTTKIANEAFASGVQAANEAIDQILFSVGPPDSAKVMILQRYSRMIGEGCEMAISQGVSIGEISARLDEEASLRSDDDEESEESFIRLVRAFGMPDGEGL